MITLDIPEQELPACELQPGWDNEEASDPEHADQAWLTAGSLHTLSHVKQTD